MVVTYSKLFADQLDIMVTGRCNARCAFCVQEATYLSENAADAVFLCAVREHVGEFYQAGGRKVVITGGEPTLRVDRVLSILAELRQYPGWDVNALYTNGSRLLDRHRHRHLTVSEELAAAGLGCVNLSVHHYQDETNDRILALPRPKLATHEIAKHLAECALPFRLNLTVQRGGIATVEDLLRYVEWGFSLGAVDVYVRGLFSFALEGRLGGDGRNPVEYTRANSIRMDEWPEEIAANSRFVFAHMHCEVDREKTEWQFEDPTTGHCFYLSTLTVGTERTDGFPYLVVMPDGRRYRGWLGQQDLVELAVLRR